MALCIYFPVKGMTVDKYGEVIRRLEDAGAGAPPGRTYHVAFKAGDDLHVVVPVAIHVSKAWIRQYVLPEQPPELQCRNPSSTGAIASRMRTIPGRGSCSPTAWAATRSPRR